MNWCNQYSVLNNKVFSYILRLIRLFIHAGIIQIQQIACVSLQQQTREYLVKSRSKIEQSSQQMDQSKHLEVFFKEQNARMRRDIRAIDLMCEEIVQNNELQVNYPNKEVSFLVVGQEDSGKRSLIKTMHFALNGYQNLQTDTVNLSDTLINRHKVKQSKVQRVQGLKCMKETSQKLSISSIQIQQISYFQNQKPFLKMTTKQKLNKFTQKYSKILNLLDRQNAEYFNNNFTNVNNLWRSMSYLADKDEKSVLPSLRNVKVVLIVVNILSIPVSEEIQCLKLFVSELRRKGLKVIFILTHVDGVNHLQQSERLNFIEQKIHFFKKKLNICDREDFICIQSYRESQIGDMYSRQKDVQEKWNSLAQMRPADCPKRIAAQQINVEVPVIRNRFNAKVSLTMTGGPMRVSSSTRFSPRFAEKGRMAELGRVRSSDVFNYGNSNTHHLPCMSYSNYPIMQKRPLNNNEQINFYSLKLLLRIIKQSKKQPRSIPKPNSLFKWLCG